MTPEQILACTLWSEDRSGNVGGMEPIAGTILNRVALPGWWGHSVPTVCLCPGQFNGWFWRDPNFQPMLMADESNPSYALAISIATRAVAGDPIERANGATHYFARSMMDRPPPWYYLNSALRTNARATCFETVHHLFFKIGLGE